MSNSNKINLLQMQRYFESQIGNVRLICDLSLSENDFKSLGAKLKSLCFFSGAGNDLEEYMLSIVVYSTYSLILGSGEEQFDVILKMIMNNNQYVERIYLNSFRETFDSFGIKTFGINSGDVRRDCQMLIARHAGIPDKEKDEFYEVLNMFSDCDDVDKLCENIYENLPERTKYFDSFWDKNHLYKALLDCRAMVMDVVDGTLNRNELIKKYQDLSISLIDKCIIWNECKKFTIRTNKFINA